MDPNKNTAGIIPNVSVIGAFLGRTTAPIVDEIIVKNLLNPVKDILGRPSKGFRSQLLELGLELALPADHHLSESQGIACQSLSYAIDMIHAGSLVVDDIHDKSQTRRGAPSLHVKYGLSAALNAGNWMYFWPLIVTHNLDIPAESRALIYQYLHEAMVYAHYGQALDTGAIMEEVPQEQAVELCVSSMELKSGALASMAFVLGAIVAGATHKEIELLAQFGRRFGLALQMFDDLANILPQHIKKYEDLMLNRPTWVWAVAAKHCSEKDYASFVLAVKRLPELTFFSSWLENFPIHTWGKKEALDAIDQAVKQLKDDFPAKSDNPVWFKLLRLCADLKMAYE